MSLASQFNDWKSKVQADPAKKGSFNDMIEMRCEEDDAREVIELAQKNANRLVPVHVFGITRGFEDAQLRPTR